MSPNSRHFTIVADLAVLTRVGLLVAVVVLRLAPAVSGAVSNHVEYGVAVILPESVSKVDSRTSADTVTVGSGVQSIVEASIGSVSAFASAAPGHIGVSLVGTADVIGPGPSVVVTGNATASWSESGVLLTPQVPRGTILQVNILVSLFGDMSAEAGPFGAAHVTVTAPGGLFTVQTANVSPGPIERRPPGRFAVTTEFGNGLETTVSGLLSISGLAQTGSGHATFAGSYSTSLHWGGIQSVKNAETGEIIDDWTITSESGVDYAHPIGFPDGDTDFDGDVDIEDLNNVRNNFGETGDHVLGDTSPFDGIVGVGDLNAVRNNFGAAPIPVPEPSSLMLMALAGLLLWRRRPASWRGLA